jgi:hypothetical protein
MLEYFTLKTENKFTLVTLNCHDNLYTQFKWHELLINQPLFSLFL